MNVGRKGWCSNESVINLQLTICVITVSDYNYSLQSYQSKWKWLSFICVISSFFSSIAPRSRWMSRFISSRRAELDQGSLSQCKQRTLRDAPLPASTVKLWRSSEETGVMTWMKGDGVIAVHKAPQASAPHHWGIIIHTTAFKTFQFSLLVQPVQRSGGSVHLRSLYFLIY